MIDFTFKGISGRTMGVLLSDHWEPVKAGKNYEQTNIEGYDGALYEELNALPVEKTLTAVVMPYAKVDKVAAWLDGEGVFARSGRYTEARIYDQIDFSRLTFQHKEIDIPFIFDPYWYSDDDYETVTEQVTNYGNVDATPLIRMTGTGTATVEINDVSFSVAFGDTEQTIEIDCKEKTEDKPSIIYIGWEYPKLEPGENEVTITTTGTVTVEMKRRSRWNVG